MNGQCIILWISFMICIIIQQMADIIGNSNQMSKDYSNSVTLTTYWDNEITQPTLENKHHYNRAQLYALMLKVNNDSRYKSIEPVPCIIIRQLRLNKWRCGKRGGTRKEIRHNHKTRGINTANLVQVLIQPGVDQDPEHKRTKQLHLLLSNIHSIKNKELLLLERLNNNNICYPMNLYA